MYLPKVVEIFWHALPDKICKTEVEITQRYKTTSFAYKCKTSGNSHGLVLTNFVVLKFENQISKLYLQIHKRNFDSRSIVKEVKTL